MSRLAPGTFRFIDPGPLVDGELSLVLVEKHPPKPERGFAAAYDFEMRRNGRAARAGGISLRIGDDENLRCYAGHIGYAVEPEYRGHRFAARSCRLILPLARSHGMRELWITCNPDNLASRRSCELAGARFVEIVPVPTEHELFKRGETEKCRYRLPL